MNHPTPEELVQYLYGENRSPMRQHLKAHLAVCAECRERVGTWQAAGKQLDTWKIKRRSERVAWLPVLRWATGAVALMALCAVAFAWGRGVSDSNRIAEMRAAIEPAMRQELRTEFATLLKTELERVETEQLKASRQETQRLLGEAESRRVAELQQIYGALLQLKQDVDTVAVNADAGLRSTEQQLFQLVSVGQSVRRNAADRSGSNN